MSAQDDANAAAMAFACNSAAQLALLANPDAACIVINGDTVCPPQVPPYSSPPGTSTFYNGPQSCVVTCADGSTTGFTAPPGRFVGANQAQADAIAMSYACQQAQLNKLCLSALDSECCQNQPASFVVLATGATGTGSWTQTGGTLPPGLTATGNNRQLAISGTPTTIGDYSFEFKCTLSSGISRTKTFTLAVMGITDASLPGFSKNVPYSFQLTTSGGTPPYAYALVSGALPAGLHLSSTGLISGTPIVDFDSYPVGISVTDGRVICRRDLSFTSPCVPVITPALEAAYAGTAVQAVYARVTGKLWAIDSSTGTSLLELNPANGAVLHTVPIVCTAINMVFYEDSNELVYIGYSSGGNSFVSSFNPTTRAIVNTAGTGTDPQQANRAVYDPLRNKVWMVSGGGNRVHVLDCASFTITTIAFSFPTFELANDIAYVSSTDRMVVSGSLFDGADTKQALNFINPGTLAQSIVDLGLILSAGGDGLVYCPHNDRLYSIHTPSFGPTVTVYIINPSAPALGPLLTLTGDVLGGVYNSCTNRLEFISVTGGNAVVNTYVNPDTNLATATLVTGQTFPFSNYYSVLPWYDDDHARVWLGTRNSLCKFT